MDPAANLDDARDPMDEAQAQLAGVRDSVHTIVLVGAGLGHVTEVAAARWPRAALVVLEPSAETAAQARRRAPSLYESRRVRMLVGPDYTGAADLWKLFDRPEAADASGVAVVRHAALTRAMPGEIVKAQRLVARAIDGARMNARAREQNAGRYLLNTFRNLPAILNSGDPARLAARFSGTPAIIVGAGPSLDRQLEDLRAVAGRAVIVAADTAWRPLVTAGIDPHFVIALDPTEANGRHLRGVHPWRETWGVIEGSVDPTASNAFGESLFTFRVGNHHPWPWLQAIGLQRPLVRAWGSVLTSAFDLTLMFGCDPIVFAGADMAFTDGRPYCRGTTFEDDWARHTARGASLRQVWRNTLAARKLVTETSVNGVAVLTAPHLIEFRNWIVRRASEASSSSAQHVLNTTPGGILTGGAIQLADLRAAFDSRPECDTAIRRIVHECQESTPNSPAAHVVIDALDSIERGSTTPTTVIDEWLTFGRPSLTIEAIRSAAAAARHRLIERSLKPGQSSSSTREATTTPRIHAADRAARMRAKLTGDATGLDGCAEISRADQFGEWAPLVAAREAIESLLALPRLTSGWGEDVTRGSDAATVPLSHRYAWTADARPLADSLEAWLLHPSLDGARRSESVLDGNRPPDAGCRVGCFWNGPIVPTDDGDLHDAESQTARADDQARCDLIDIELELSSESASNERSTRLIAAGERAQAPRALDSIMRAITGTIARPIQAARDPRVAFLQNDVSHIEPEVLTDRGLPLGWNVVTADRHRALFTPRLLNHSLAIDADGAWTPVAAWPQPIVGEVPWGEAGGALAWNASEQLILSRARQGEEALVDRVSFQPSRVEQTPNGEFVWAALNGGLWHWSPGQSGRRLIETPKCIGLLVADAELILSPVARDGSGQIRRRRLLFQYRYRMESQSLRECEATPDGPFVSQSTRGQWTARSHPFADLIRLEASDGRRLVMAVYSPFQLAWAGTSLLVTITDGVALLFPRLIDRLEQISDQLSATSLQAR